MKTSGELGGTRSIIPRQSAAAGERSYLLAFDGTGSSWVVPLPPEGVIRIGRAPQSDVILRDATASRDHARILAAPGGEVRLTDLGSRNGTLLNGERVEGTRPLASGDVIAIGDTILVLRGARPRAEHGALLGPDALRRRLESEVERALLGGRPAAVVLVGLGAPVAHLGARGPIRAALARVLGPLDAAGVAGELLLWILPERDAETALLPVEALLAALAPSWPEARAGIACCPSDGAEPDALVAAARSALAAAAAGTAREAGSLDQVRRIGDRRVIVADAAMVQIYDLLARLGPSELPVLICGETGTGKENAAYAVHARSRRAAGPFITVNCATLQDTLAESQLFGHDRGAFSGADRAKEGLLEAAAGGTVFLDEVGELSPQVQAKLLRALESKRITRVGEVREREIDVRIVAATNRDLEAEALAGRFRRDLLFRLNAALVQLPPLRERPREIGLLARLFLDEACRRDGRPRAVIATATMALLVRHAWPGNVRELKNLMDFASAAVPGDVLEPWHLAKRLGVPEAEPAGPEPADASAKPPAGEVEDPAARFRPIAEELRELEQRRMVEALRAAGGVQKKAAALIGMPLRTFVYKLRQYGLGPRAADGDGEG